MPASDLTLTATATANKYTVRFNPNPSAEMTAAGVTVSGTMADQSFTYGAAGALADNLFKAAGFNFVGWNTLANGTGTAYTDGASVSNLTTENNGVIDLYAQWTTPKVWLQSTAIDSAKIDNLIRADLDPSGTGYATLADAIAADIKG